MTLVRNPDYHGRFKGNVGRIELPFGLKPGPSLERMYEEGALDVLNLEGLPLEEVQDLAHRRYAGEFTLLSAWVVRSLIFDAGRSPFDDPHLRQALALAIDKEHLTDMLYKGFHSPATGGYLPPGMPGHSPGIGLPYDPQRAQRLLAEAGYPDGNGFPRLDSMILYHYASLGEYLRTQWRKHLGIEVLWKTVEWDDYINVNKMSGLQANMVIFGVFPAYPDPESLLGTEGMYRITKWRHAGYQRLVERARRLQDLETRLSLYRQAERILINEAAIAPLFYHRSPTLVKPWVKGFTLSPVMDWSWKDVIIEPH